MTAAPTPPPGRGNVRRPGGSEHPHDPRRPGPGAPRKDHRRPAGDEGVNERNDDVPTVKDKAKAPIPDVPDVGKPPAVE